MTMILSRRKTFLSLTILWVTYLTFTVLKGYIIIHGLFSILVISLFSFLLYPKQIFNKPLFFLGLYSVVVLLNSLSGDQVFTLQRSVLEILFLFSTSFIFLVFMRNAHYNELWVFIKVTLIIAIVLSVTSIPQLIINPLLVRSLTKIDELDIGYTIYRTWISDYAKAHVVIFIFPPLVYIVKGKFKRIFKIASAVVILILFAYVAVSSATTPLILGTLGIVLSILINQKFSLKRNLFHLMLISLPLLFLLNNSVLIYSLVTIKPFFEGSTNYEKIDLIITYMQYGSSEGGIEARENFHSVSWTSFNSNPFLGTNSIEGMGRHSFYLDRMAMFGVVGFIPLLLFFVSFTVEVIKELTHTKIYYLVGVFVYLIMFSMKNIFSIEFLLYSLVLLPGLCLCIDKGIISKTILLDESPSYNQKA
jgi:hypothetical protein